MCDLLTRLAENPQRICPHENKSCGRSLLLVIQARDAVPRFFYAPRRATPPRGFGGLGVFTSAACRGGAGRVCDAARAAPACRTVRHVMRRQR